MLLICIASVLVCSAAEFSVLAPNGSVSAYLGSSAILPCGLSPSISAETFEVRWYKHSDREHLVLLYKDLKVQEKAGDPQYSSRASLIGELKKGNVSLKLENLTLEDRGEYVCLVRGVVVSDKAGTTLLIKVLGSLPVLSCAEAGGQVNVTCASGGWLPKPTVTWRDRGRELSNSHVQYKTGSEGLVSVSSWLLVSPSESEWISCSVGLSDQETKEGRVLPRKGPWREAFISAVVLLLIIIIIIIFTVLLLVRQGLMPHCLSQDAKATVNAHESRSPETLPLAGLMPHCSSHQDAKVNAHESRSPETLPLAGLMPHCSSHQDAKVNAHESRSPETLPLTAVSEDSFPVESHLDTDESEEAAVDSGTSSPVPPGSAEERMKIWIEHKERKEKLTVDPDTRHRSLTVTREGTGVYCGQLDSYRQYQSDPFPHALSREEFSSGLNYWEVKVEGNLSWCVGVTQKPPTKETLTALCYDVGRGIYTSTDPRTEVPAEGQVTTLGLLLDFKHSRLSFYNVDPPSHLHTFTMENMKNRTYCALISPGSEDTEPVSFRS